MKLTFDTDSILYRIINGSVDITSAISGSVYNGDRPDDSELEDITVNTITLTQDSVPQLGTSNINVHVSDKDVTINGAIQKKADTLRLKTIANLVLDALRAAKVDGVGFVIDNQTTIREQEINQHYVNLRISWSIH